MLYFEAAKRRDDVDKTSKSISASVFCLLLYFGLQYTASKQVRHIVTFAGFSLVFLCLMAVVVKTRYSRFSMLCVATLIVVQMAGILLSPVIDIDLIYRNVSFFALILLYINSKRSASLSLNYDYVNIVFVAISIICLALSFSPLSHTTESGRVEQGLTLGMTNPNLTGMMLVGSLEVLVIVYPQSRHKRLTILAIATLLYLLLLTEARSSIIAAVAVLAYWLLFARFRVPASLQLAIMVLPILVVPIYLNLSEPLQQLEFMGKSVYSGRALTFSQYLILLDTPLHKLFGNMGMARFGNAHNSMLLMLSNLGFLGTILSETIIMKSVLGIGKYQQSLSSRLGLVSLLSVFLQSSAEADFFSGGFPSIVFVYLFIAFANDAVTAKKTNAARRASSKITGIAAQ